MVHTIYGSIHVVFSMALFSCSKGLQTAKSNLHCRLVCKAYVSIVFNLPTHVAGLGLLKDTIVAPFVLIAAGRARPKHFFRTAV